MKRKQSTAPTTGRKGDKETSPVRKRARNATNQNREEEEEETRHDELIDVQTFLLRDCQASSKKLVEQAKKRAEELRREMEEDKRALLEALEAEKENLDENGNIIPQAYTISVRCVNGLYEGRKFSMDINTKRHSSCFIGRSTGRKFRPPRGLSMPKDSELSTSHGEIKMEATGKLFFTDLDSTNGTRIDDVDLEANEPYELTLSKPIKLEVGAGELELTFEVKS